MNLTKPERLRQGDTIGIVAPSMYIHDEQAVERGEMGRPSLLYLRAEEEDGKIDVSIGGKLVMVAKGELV